MINIRLCLNFKTVIFKNRLLAERIQFSHDWIFELHRKFLASVRD